MAQNAASGPLIWVHVPQEGALSPVEDLAKRLISELPALRVLITTQTVPLNALQGAITYVKPPTDKRSEVQPFLARWAPDLCLWTRGAIRPVLLTEVETLGIPCYLIDAAEASVSSGRAPWSRLAQRGHLRRFRHLLAQDERTAQKLASQGAQAWRIEVTGALLESAAALPFAAAERDELAEALVSRRLWYGADIPDLEFETAVKAHQETLGRAHRTLAVITPKQLSSAPQLASIARDQGLRVDMRSETDEIDPECQLLVADFPDEHGLWFRLAPVSYLGGTLSTGKCRDPFEPAALGSAIIHGPALGAYKSKFDRLAHAQAAKAIGSAAELGAALSHLGAPDRSAILAHAAWDASSAGASAADRVVELALEALAEREVS
ncbi:MAG: glycosyltransferase N-terminal domain-containing protein [Pseudomonadota bacterium]